MKRIIYTLTAIFSTSAAAILIIMYIESINEFGEFFYPNSLIIIAVLLALGVLSVIQLKMSTPRILLILSGYIFFETVMTINSSQYLFGLLFMAAALIPAVYELSHYGMAVRQEPRRSEKSRWMLAAAPVLALALCAYTIMLIVTQASLNKSGSVMLFPMDYSGIAALLSAAAFCALMNRHTSVLYRMFFSGCVIFYGIQSIPSQYFFMDYYLSDSADMLFITMSVIYALFVLLIFVHAILTWRGDLKNKITREAQDQTGQAFNNAVKEG